MVRKLVLEKADRLYHLPPLLGDFLPRRERKKMLGREIIDLARFSWPTGSSDKTSGDAPPYAGEDQIADLAEKTAAWYKARYGGRINPAKELFIGGGIRQILNLLALAYFNPGDLVLVPDPGVWHYRAGAVLASAETMPYGLSERNRFKPAMSSFSVSVARTARAMVLNSPHNPTGAILNKDNLAEILYVAGRENLMLILDQAFDGFIDGDNPASLFSIPGGRKVAVELYSYAYNFGRPQPSCALAVAQPAIIASLKRIAEVFSHRIDAGQWQSAMDACADSGSKLDEMKNAFAKNRDMIDKLCDKLRLIPSPYRVGPFYWAKLPGRKQSRRFCRVLYMKAGILAIPGVAFGENGEGFIRFSLTGKPETYQKALDATRRLFQSSKERGTGNG